MPFEPGQSGNPGGRPKETAEVKELARQHSVESIGRLVDWMRSDNPKASVAACNALLDRGFGKPAQALSVDGTVDAGAGLLAVLANMKSGNDAR